MKQKQFQNRAVRPLTDEERDRLAQHTGIAYRYMPNRSYTEDEQQLAWIAIINNWTRNRESHMAVKDVTFVGQSARFRAFRAKCKPKSTFNLNRCLSIHGTGEDDEVYPLTNLPRSDEIAERDDELTLLRKCYGCLSEREKEIVRLHNLGYNHREIGDRIGLSKGRVGQVFSQIILILKEALKKEMANVG